MRFKTLLLIVAILYVPDRDRLKLSVYEGQNTKITEQMKPAKKVTRIPKYKQTFLNVLVPMIRNEKYPTIKTSVILAQAALESGWLRRYPKKTNNILGICVNKKIRIYPDITNCLYHHKMIMELADRYKPVRDAQTYQEQCDQLLKCGYAEDPNYSKKLKSIIKTNKLYQYDN